MAVGTGSRRYIGTFTVGSPVTFGQGPYIRYELLMSFDDSSVSIPTWTYVTDYLRAFSTSRGRASELSDVDAGTASLTLDNRSRRFDPSNASGPYYPNLRPMNRVWLRMQFNGLTHDVFKGWVESYEQQFPEAGVDAVTAVHAVDEFKVLALGALATTDPPRPTYADVVRSDSPAGYWTMNGTLAGFFIPAEIGPDFEIGLSGGFSLSAFGAIVGFNPGSDTDAIAGFASTSFTAGNYVTTPDLATGDLINLTGANALSVEFWYKTDNAAPGSANYLFQGPGPPGAGWQWYFIQNTNGTIRFGTTDDTLADHACDSNVIAPGVWMHVCGTYDGTTQRIYINGVERGNAAWSGVIKTSTSHITVGSDTISSLYYDEFAIYRTALSASRVAAHYTAGANRGFPFQQLPGARIGAILDSATSQAPRSLRPGARQMGGQYTGEGPATLEALRVAENAEAVDAVLFVASDGTITFLDGDHRSASPWNTVQATFGDAGGSELDFMDIQLDYSDSFIENEWNVTQDGGVTKTASDATSISRYYKRSQSLTGLSLAGTADVQDVANDMLAKYKEPFTRVLSITPKTMDVNVVEPVFQLDIGDRVRVLLTPLGGGTRVDQTLFVQSIGIDATPQAIFPTVKLGVSPV